MPTITYTLSALSPNTHRVDVSIEIQGLRTPMVDLVMPAWTPGSYKIRDYARHVQDFSAGKFAWKKLDKNRWQVRTNGAERVTVRYSVHAFELNARGAHLDAHHLYFNGAAVFMYVDGQKERPVTLDLRIPKGWNVATGLRKTGPRSYAAADYDELIDCPTEVGRFQSRTWKHKGIPHHLAVYGPGNYDLDRLVKDFDKIVTAESRMFGGLPYRDYTFILHTVGDAYGGLEHRNSTTLQYPPHAFKGTEKYENFLELTAHEYFHLWNVKRLRPSQLGPFDYEREVQTTLLWALEGFTSYYDGLMLVRAGLTTPARYLKKLASRYQAYLEKPGRRHHTLGESSFDTWIKYYQPHEHSANSTISYYEKGEFVGFCLDMEIRRRTKNRRTLDDVLRRLYDECRKSGAGFPESRYRQVAEDVAGGSLSAFWRDYIDGTRELSFDGALGTAGLVLKRETDKEDGKEKPAIRGWIGILVQKSGTHLSVSTVREGSPGEQAGICPRDEIIAMDGARVDSESWERRLQERKTGDRIRFTLFRAGFLHDITVKVGKRESHSLKIQAAAKADAIQKTVYRDWMGEAWKKG